MADNTPGTSTTVTIKVPGGKVVRIEHDLPFGAVADIATRHNVHWAVLLGSPIACPGGALLDLFVACCKQAGAPVPDLVNARMLYDSVGSEPDDLPEYWQDTDDGNGLLPKAEPPTTT